MTYRTTFPFRLSTLADLTSRHSPPGPSEAGAQWHPMQTQQLKVVPERLVLAHKLLQILPIVRQRSTRVRSWHGVCDPAKQRLSFIRFNTCGYVPRYRHTVDSWLFIKVGP